MANNYIYILTINRIRNSNFNFINSKILYLESQ